MRVVNGSSSQTCPHVYFSALQLLKRKSQSTSQEFSSTEISTSGTRTAQLSRGEAHSWYCHCRMLTGESLALWDLILFETRVRKPSSWLMRSASTRWAPPESSLWVCTTKKKMGRNTEFFRFALRCKMVQLRKKATGLLFIVCDKTVCAELLTSIVLINIFFVIDDQISSNQSFI